MTEDARTTGLATASGPDARDTGRRERAPAVDPERKADRGTPHRSAATWPSTATCRGAVMAAATCRGAVMAAATCRGVVMAAYWSLAACLWAAVLWRPDWAPALMGAAGLAGAGGVALGVRLHRPRRRLPWAMLAISIVFAAQGNALVRLAAGGGGSKALPHLGGTSQVIFFAVGAAALFGLSRSASHSHNRSGMLDAVTVAVASALVIWVCARGPWLDSLPDDRAALVVTHLAGEVILFGATARLLTAHRSATPVSLLVTGVLAMLVSDVILGLCLATGTRGLAAFGAIGYLVHPAAWGAAALHPAMARLNESELAPAWDVNDRRQKLLLGASLAGPAALVVRSLQGGLLDGALLAAGTGAICLVSLLRLSDAATAVQRFLAHRERHDALTGLANRTRFTERLAEIMATPPHARPDATVLLVALDNLRLLNDAMGRPSGDEALLAAARRLAGGLGQDDLAARVGGDEFALLLLPDDAPIAAPMSPQRAAARVVDALSPPVWISSREIRVTASIGIATISDVLPAGAPAAVVPRHAAQEMLGHAGLALHAAQAAGEGRSYRYQPDLHGLMVERMGLRSALERAVADGSFALRFQPIVSLDDGTTAAFEALIRWEHPDRGLIPPDEFIKAAEETGLIGPIGEWVLHRAVQTAATWQTAGTPRLRVSVNVSVHQLRTGAEGMGPGFAERVNWELAEAGLPAANLVLEITESALLGDEDEIWSELRALREAGVHLAIDDFGTGFASMSYLLDTPIEILKIDQRFVQGLSGSPRRQALVEGVVRMCADIGLTVVAEGVETPADRDLLAGIGCPYGQGFLFAEPLTDVEVTAWLRSCPR